MKSAVRLLSTGCLLLAALLSEFAVAKIITEHLESLN